MVLCLSHSVCIVWGHPHVSVAHVWKSISVIPEFFVRDTQSLKLEAAGGTAEEFKKLSESAYVPVLPSIAIREAVPEARHNLFNAERCYFHFNTSHNLATSVKLNLLTTNKSLTKVCLTTCMH